MPISILEGILSDPIEFLIKRSTDLRSLFVDEEKELMEIWNLSDPPSWWEKDLNSKIDKGFGM